MHIGSDIGAMHYVRRRIDQCPHSHVGIWRGRSKGWCNIKFVQRVCRPAYKPQPSGDTWRAPTRICSVVEELFRTQTSRQLAPIAFQNGRVPEWTNGTVSKTVRGASLSGVQIPPLPPCKSVYSLNCGLCVGICGDTLNGCSKFKVFLLKLVAVSL